MVMSLIAAILGASMLPPDHLAIATRVAGPGLPQCRLTQADGREGPCLPSFALSASGGINGHSRAGHITFTRGATIRLTADEFALLAGHEIAHWYLGHTGEGDAATRREAELAADRLGAQLACQAGYDVTKGTGVYRFMSKSRVHPERAVRVRAVLAVGCGTDYGESAESLYLDPVIYPSSNFDAHTMKSPFGCPVKIDASFLRDRLS